MILMLLALLAAAVIAWRAIEAIDAMTRNTHHGIRAAWLLLALGAIGTLAAPAFGYAPPRVPDILMMGGVAMFCLVDRRRRGGHDQP